MYIFQTMRKCLTLSFLGFLLIPLAAMASGLEDMPENELAQLEQACVAKDMAACKKAYKVIGAKIRSFTLSATTEVALAQRAYEILVQRCAMDHADSCLYAGSATKTGQLSIARRKFLISAGENTKETFYKRGCEMDQMIACSSFGDHEKACGLGWKKSCDILTPETLASIHDLPPKYWSSLKVRVFGYFALEGAHYGEKTLHTRTDYREAQGGRCQAGCW